MIFVLQTRGLRWPVVAGKETAWRFRDGLDPYAEKGSGVQFYGNADKKARVLGLPNRVIVVLAFSLIAVCVETLLNRWGALSWDYWWWGWPHIWTVILLAYGPASLFTVWVHDLQSWSAKIKILAGVYLLDAVLLIVFIRLKWI